MSDSHFFEKQYFSAHEVKVLKLDKSLISSNRYTISPENGNLFIEFVYQGEKISYPIEFDNQHISLSDLKKLIGLKWIELQIFDTDDECNNCNCNGCSCNDCSGCCNDCSNTPCKNCNGCDNCIYNNDYAVKITTNQSFQSYIEKQLKVISNFSKANSGCTQKEYNNYLESINKQDVDFLILYKENITSSILTEYLEKSIGLKQLMNLRGNSEKVNKITIEINDNSLYNRFVISRSSVCVSDYSILFWSNHLLISFQTFDYIKDEFVDFSQEFPLGNRAREKEVARRLRSKSLIFIRFERSHGALWECFMT